MKTLREQGDEIARWFKAGEIDFEAGMKLLKKLGFNAEAARSILYCGKVGG